MSEACTQMKRIVKNQPISKFLLETSGYACGPENGLFQGNGDIFTSFWNEAHELTWSVGKTDVWDRRYFGDSKKVTTLEEIKKIAFNEEPEKKLSNKNPGLPGSAHLLYRAYDFPCPKPVGQIIIRCPQFKGTRCHNAELDLSRGVLTVKAKKGDTKCDVTGFVSAIRNVVVINAVYQNINEPIRLELYRHKDTILRGKTVMQMSGSYPPFDYDYDQDPENGPIEPPEVGSDGYFFWIRQRFPAEMTFPQGFEYVMMAVIPGTEYHVSTYENIKGAGAKVPLREISLKKWQSMRGAWKEKRKAIEMVNKAPGWLASAEIKNGRNQSFTAYISIMTTRDATNPFDAARKELQSATAADHTRLLEEHCNWWKMYWARSFIETDDKKLDQALYESLYRVGWSMRKGKVPLYNATTPLFTDATPWHGDYHFNELWFHPIIISNHGEELVSWMEMIEEMLPMAQANARDVYNCRGCCFTMIHYPIKSKRVVYSNQVWELGIEMTGLVLQVFWQYYQYTGNISFLRNKAYPIMREGARFYADYVKKGKDGYYHVIPTVSQENWGITKNFKYNRDSVGALSMIRYHLNACINASEKLGLDLEERKKWQEIVMHLAPYPTYMTDEGPIFVDVRDAPPNPRLIQCADLAMVLWGEHIHLDSDPELLEIARRTYLLMDKENKKYHWKHRPSYMATIERRLGLPRTVPVFEVEDLLMSCTGQIHLFPGVPADMGARFERLLAVGGFEVSAQKKGGKVGSFRVKSLAGECCRFKNPWRPYLPSVMRLSDRQHIPVEVNNDTVSFPTLPTEVYEIRKVV